MQIWEDEYIPIHHLRMFWVLSIWQSDLWKTVAHETIEVYWEHFYDETHTISWSGCSTACISLVVPPGECVDVRLDVRVKRHLVAVVETTQQTHVINSMLVYCWPTVYDVGPMINQHWINGVCFQPFLWEVRLLDWQNLVTYIQIYIAL